MTLIGDFMDIIQYNGDNTVYADITVKKVSVSKKQILKILTHLPSRGTFLELK